MGLTREEFLKLTPREQREYMARMMRGPSPRSSAAPEPHATSGAPERPALSQAILEQTYDAFMHSSSADHAEVTRFTEWTEEVKRAGMFSFDATRLTAQRPEVEMVRHDGERFKLISMSAYNYLGYSHHPEVIAAAREGLERYGLGAGASPIVSGSFDIHRKLEQRLVELFGLEGHSAAVFSSGYAVNTGTLSAYLKAGHWAVLDRAVHASILEGAQLSRAQMAYFRHNDPDHLRQVLTRVSADKTRMLVCVEGVYSADGDFGRLKEIVAVAKEFGARVLVDEAHSVLIAGPHGRGVADEQGVLRDIDFLVLTFSKAFGGVGGAVLARRGLTEYVSWYARCRVFSCALDLAVTAGVLKSLELGAGPDGDERRARLKANAAWMRERLAPHVDIGGSTSWIIPVMFGPERQTVPLTDWLQRHGLDGSTMQFPAVPKNEARVRLFVTSEHTREQLEQAAKCIIEAAGRFGFARQPTERKSLGP